MGSIATVRRTRSLTKLRFRGQVTDGKITRWEETLDANYIQAFERIGYYMEQAKAT